MSYGTSSEMWRSVSEQADRLYELAGDLREQEDAVSSYRFILAQALEAASRGVVAVACAAAHESVEAREGARKRAVARLLEAACLLSRL